MRWPWTSPRPGGSRPAASRSAGRPVPVPTEDHPDRGSAIVEFIALGLLLLVPVIYLVVTIARVQAGAFAVVAASEQAAQAISVLDGENLNTAEVQEVAAVAVADQGFAARDLSLAVTCSDGSCTSPGAVATVRADLTVDLPAVPGFAHARVAALHSQVTVLSGRYS